MKIRATLLLAALGYSAVVQAGSTGQTMLHMIQGSDAGTPNGDYVTAVAGLDDPYRYFVEVPAGVPRLVVELYDADVGSGGVGEATAGRDRARGGGGFNTTATYAVFNPAGVAQTTSFTTGNVAAPVGADAAWLTLFDTNIAINKTVRDQFDTIAYTNNDGTDNWSTAWAETGDDLAANAGEIQITGGELRMGGTATISRQADLSATGLNLSSATLTFDYRTFQMDPGDPVVLEISSNGASGPFTVLETFTGNTTTPGTRSFNITTHISNSTRIRFTTSGLATNGGNVEYLFVDNVQITGTQAAFVMTPGHWEIRVTQSAGGDDINALGVRAHDGTSGAGGTELNVYADSLVSLGINPSPGAATRAYTLYPWITSGCQCSQNDFDRDTDSGDTGSVVYRSRLNLVNPAAGFTETFTSATLSADNSWNRDSLTQWGDDDESDDYGIWRFSPTINTYDNGTVNGNYETTYVGSYLAGANPPGANPVVDGSSNPAAFRIYLPTDAGVDAGPVKPYLEQFLTYNRTGGGPNPGQVGVQTVYTVSIRVVNPTIYPITFNASNLVSTNIPAGTGVTYGGGAMFSQGAMVTQPAVGGTGDLTWNPSTLAAGGTALLAYNIRVTPPGAARIIVTPTPASANGTRAQYIDETGNTTQTRARYLMGGVCELAVTAALATEVLLSSFHIDARGGASTIEWSTASEAGTVGFNLYRGSNGAKVNESLIPASLKAHGGQYQFLDRGNDDPNATYTIEEILANGEKKHYGPLNRLEDVRAKAGIGPRRRDQVASNAISVASSHAAKDPAVAVMVGVRATGVARVAAVDLAAILGADVKDVTKGLQQGRLSVTSNGTQVAWTADEQNLYFYGQKSSAIYSDESVYRVELLNGIGGTKMQTVQWTAAAAPVSAYRATQEIEADRFAATVVPVDPQSDYYFWDYVISGDATHGRKTFSVHVPSVASASGALLAVRLQGAYKGGAHAARITLNGVPVGETSFTSFDAHSATLSVPAAVLRDGANEIGVEGVLASGAALDFFYIDGFTLQYQRFAKPEAGQLEMPATAAVGVGPFTAAPIILDVTAPLRPAIVTGAAFTNGIASLQVPSPKTLIFAQETIRPSSLRGTAAAQLKTRSLRADWAIIAPRAMRTAAESLAALRRRDGLTTYVADLEQIYDEFAGGNVTPLAIRDFVRSTRTWSQAPKYFVLAGTGSIDYRSIVTPAGPMPPLLTSTAHGLYASDSLYTDLNGDGRPDVAIGRIPVRTAGELSAYVAKLEANGQIAVGSSPVVFAADGNDNGTSFTNASKRAQAALGGRPAARIDIDAVGGGAARSALIASWNSGTPLVSWTGHGGLDRFSSAGVLTSGDMASLGSTGRLPVVVAMTCTINRFENGYVDPLGAALTNEPDGGALAVWSASGLSVHAQASDLQNTFMRLAAQAPSTTRLGDLILRSLAAEMSDTASVYLLLGDPAIRLELPTLEVTNGGTAVNRGE